MQILCSCGKKLMWTEKIKAPEGKKTKAPETKWVDTIMGEPPTNEIFSITCPDCSVILIDVRKGPLPPERKPAIIQINVN